MLGSEPSCCRTSAGPRRTCCCAKAGPTRPCPSRPRHGGRLCLRSRALLMGFRGPVHRAHNPHWPSLSGVGVWRQGGRFTTGAFAVRRFIGTQGQEMRVGIDWWTDMKRIFNRANRITGSLQLRTDSDHFGQPAAFPSPPSGSRSGQPAPHGAPFDGFVAGDACVCDQERHFRTR